MQRICLFGGTFDPIHCAHLRIAEEAVRRFALNRVLFVPVGNPPHKDVASLAPYEDRFRMVQIACSLHPNLEASRLEDSERRSYSIDTLKKLRSQVKPDDRVFFLIGADAFDEIETWKDWQDLVKLTEFIVVAGAEIPCGAGRLRPSIDRLISPGFELNDSREAGGWRTHA